MQKILLAVPSRERSFLLKESKRSFKYLKKLDQNLIDVIVFISNSPKEIENYKNNLFRTVPLNYNYISQKIKKIIEYAISNNYNQLILMEDDVSLYKLTGVSNEYGNYYNIITNTNQLNKLFNIMIITCNEEFIMTHPVGRLGSNQIKRTFVCNKRITGKLLCLNLEVFKTIDLSILETVMYKEDYCLVLLSLLNGYKTLGISEFCTEDTKRGYRGGSSTNRTLEKYNESTKIFYNYFKEKIDLSLRYKNTKSNELFNGQTLEVVMNLSKFEHKITKDYFKNISDVEYFKGEL